MPSLYEQAGLVTPHLARAKRATFKSNDISVGAPPVELPPELQTIRDACDGSLQTFLETCFPEVFVLGWSPDHLRIIKEIQRHMDDGGLQAIGMPRGTGKTSILIRASLFAVLTNRRRYVCIVASNEDAAVSNLDTIKTEINFNPILTQLYARELYCLRKLDQEPIAMHNQHWNGTKTGVVYKQRQLCFGSIPDCKSNGAVITTAGITGKIRGQVWQTVDGESLRPDLVLVDDPSTKSSAASNAQNTKRHSVMMGDCLGLAGPGVKIAGFAAVTVIYQGDLADRILDRDLSPDWNGEKVSMIKKWPKNMDLWDAYNAMRQQELKEARPHRESIQFVRDNYKELHEDAEVYWEDRKADSDVSALHHAMDLYFRDQGVFAAEFQNSPMSAFQSPPYELNADTISRRTIGIPRGYIPTETTHITGFIDVQRELLYFMLVAWTREGRAVIIDYGAAPDQQRHHWTKPTVNHSLQAIFGDDLETALRGGLEWLCNAILETDYVTEDGSTLQVNRIAIDARWAESTEVIRTFVRQSKHRSRLHPSMGMYIGANSRTWQKLKFDKKTEKKGIHAKLQKPKTVGQRELLYDTNFWKSFAADRLLCSTGSPKAILLFDAQPHEHRMFSEHCVYEEPVRVIGKADNEVVEWRTERLAGSIENDLWDCLVGNCALASVIGVDTHVGIRHGSAQLADAIARVREKKPKSQFFRSR